MLYAIGSSSLMSEMNDLQAAARRVGITIDLSPRSATAVTSTATPCSPRSAACQWQAADWNSGWVYADPYLPTGEILFATGATTNFGSYSSARADALIDATISTPTDREAQALGDYATYMSQQLPVIYTPTSIGLYSSNAGTLVSDRLGGFTANTLTYLTPEAWYLTR